MHINGFARGQRSPSSASSKLSVAFITGSQMDSFLVASRGTLRAASSPFHIVYIFRPKVCARRGGTCVVILRSIIGTSPTNHLSQYRNPLLSHSSSNHWAAFLSVSRPPSPGLNPPLIPIHKASPARHVLHHPIAGHHLRFHRPFPLPTWSCPHSALRSLPSDPCLSLVSWGNPIPSHTKSLVFFCVNPFMQSDSNIFKESP